MRTRRSVSDADGTHSRISLTPVPDETINDFDIDASHTPGNYSMVLIETGR